MLVKNESSKRRTVGAEAGEEQRLSALYGRLREKLLDLTKRNRMLNYSLGARSKRQIQIFDEIPEEVYRQLAEGGLKLDIVPLAEPKGDPADEKSPEFVAELRRSKESDIEYLTRLQALESNARDDDQAIAGAERDLRDRLRAKLGMPPRPTRADINRNEHAKQLGIDPNPELPVSASKSSHKDKKLQTIKYPDELENVLEKISADARLAEQEMGLSTLFLAFGFVEWYESNASDKSYFAPLLLLPVRLEARKLQRREVFSISATNENAEENLSLQKYLEKEFGRELPDFESDEERKGDTIDGYFQKALETIKGLNRWRVHRWMVLGHFAFGRLAMYADVAPENWNKSPAESRLIRSVLSGTETPGEGGLLPSAPGDYQIDDEETERFAPFLIHDADASQHSALIDVMKSTDLVIQGPPGTGKSQTITNIIANCLAAKKRVLFLAEKLAALEVVKRRLDNAGLGEFCLELHSEKASPRHVIESIKRRIEIVDHGSKSGSKSKTDGTWATSRGKISEYLKALHDPDDAGHTPFTHMWRSIRGRSEQDSIFASFKGVPVPNIDPNILGQVDIYANVAQSFADSHGQPATSPWAGLGLESLRAYEVGDLTDSMLRLSSTIEGLQRALRDWQDVGISSPDEIRSLVAANSRIGARPPESEVLEAISTLDSAKLIQVIQLKRALSATESEIQERSELSSYSLETLKRASEIVRCDRSSTISGFKPIEAMASAERAIQEGLRLTALIDAMHPALKLLGLDASFPANGLEAVSAICLIASRIDPPRRRWVCDHCDIDVRAFQAARTRWKDIVGREEMWRSRLVGHQVDPWPPVHEIAEAAEALSVRGLSKIASHMSGKIRAAKEFLTGMGFNPEALPSTHELKNLVAHIAESESFEADQTLSVLLGRDWAGLNTPIEDIEYGIQFRALLADRISVMPHGSEVISQFIQAGANGIAALARHSENATHIRSLPSDIKKRLNQKSIEFVIAELHSEVGDYQRIVAIDRERSLINIKWPLIEIHRMANALQQRNEFMEKLKQPEVIREVAATNANTNAFEQFPQAIIWRDEIRRLPISGAMQVRLVTAGAEQFRERLQHFCSRANMLLERFDADRQLLKSKFGIVNLDESSLENLGKSLSVLVARRNELVDLLSLQQQRRILEEAGLGEFLQVADSINLEPKKLPIVIELLEAHNRGDTARRERPALSTHSGSVLEAYRHAFSERDKNKIIADRKAIFSELVRGAPQAGSDHGPKKTWTEMALLRNEISKERRFTPIRAMMRRAGESLLTLKPCFMMSPLSLAKFLPAGAIHFDLVVIDEASQMRPEDALGGLLRADQIVVVGDPKQLPPTDFFNRTAATAGEIGDEDFDEVDDESILQACNNAFRQVRRLKWHYRSRCESLIAFSNKLFYENGLITFPSAKPGSFSIDLVRVNGAYQARRNITEAIRIAEEAAEFMRHFAGANKDSIPTLGIAAVNIEQRDLIREELHRACAGEDAIDEYLAKVEEKGEPLFVKNLENVQGDERDYIFVSLTYGRPAEGAVMRQHFGPINGKYGHRRLNVLFSRARMRLALFASFGSVDVAPTEKSHEGVQILKRYLEYAESRGFVEPGRAGSEPDSDFEIAVADRLRSRGHAIDYQIGVSGFRIDLGVRHPDDPTRFLAGIECDGARYHSSKSARDRDRLREQVLRDLGWEILRVWSTDWFENPDIETDKLIAKLERLRELPPKAFNDYSIVSESRAPSRPSP